MKVSLPAWSDKFSAENLSLVSDGLPEGPITREWAWGNTSGRGIRVGILDSGIDGHHPAVGKEISGWASFYLDRASGEVVRSMEVHDDSFGHGTACADVVRRLAPEADLVSIKVLGSNLRGRAVEFLAGLDWAIQEGLDVINLSLGTTNSDYYAKFHRLTEEAYFRGICIVTAVNNMPIVSYPSMYSSAFSVACVPDREGYDPFEFYYSSSPPPEFGASGVGIDLAWAGGNTLSVTGNSFAAPHIAGLLARIRSKHRDLTPFQLKTVLRATALNTSGAEL